MPRRVNSGLKPHRRRTDDKLDLDDLIAAPNLGGMLSFLEVPPDEARRRHELRRAVDEQGVEIGLTHEIAPTTVGSAPPVVYNSTEVTQPTEVDIATAMSRTTVADIHRRAYQLQGPRWPTGVGNAPVSQESIDGSAPVFQGIKTDHDSNPHDTPTVVHATTEGYPHTVVPEHIVGAPAPVDEVRLDNRAAYLEPTTLSAKGVKCTYPPIPNPPTVVPPPTLQRRDRIFRATLVQHGHSPAEQILYQALWNHGSPSLDGSRRITAGYRELGYMTNLNDKTIKFNLQSLQTKLAIQVIAPENTFTRTGRTYQVFSYDEILQRRNRAGLIWVRKTKGVEFVSLSGTESGLPRTSTTVAPSPTVVSSTSGSYNQAQHSGPEAHEPTVVLDPRGNREASTTGAGVAPTTQIGNTLGNTISKPASSDPLPFALPKTLSRYFPAIDHSAVENLWNDCRDRATDCTVEEVLYFVNQKLPIARSGKIQNPVGFLITTVPRCFEGETFQHFRREQARLKEEQRRREEEERQRQQAVEAEIAEFRREEEARQKAEQVLPTLSDEERKALYDEAKADLSAKGYKATGSTLEKLMQERVIHNLAKRIPSEA